MIFDKIASLLSRRVVPQSKAIGESHNKAGDNVISESFTTYTRNEVPGGDTSSDSGKIAAFTKARNIARSNYWLRAYFQSKLDHVIYGLSFTAGSESSKAEGSKSEKARPSLEDWLNQPIKLVAEALDENDAKSVGIAGGADITNRVKLTKFVRDAAYEFLVQDNVIASWTDGMESAVTLPLEQCRYLDTLGIETLFYRHGLTTQQIKLLPPEDQERYKEAELNFDPEKGEYFSVLKNERTGSGLAWPSVQSVFRCAATMESMEMGESYYAYGGRVKLRHWKKGHEIKQGQHAGKPTHFWKTEHSRLIQRVFENKSGHFGDFVTNFDLALEHPHESTDYYDQKKWESPEHRLKTWGGAIAYLISEKGRSEDLMQAVKAQILAIREPLTMFLEGVINQAWNTPTPIKIRFSNTVFAAARIAAEDRKFGVTSGSLTHSTWRQEAGYDDQQESLKKEAEAKEFASNPQKFMPPFDPAHGVQDTPPAGGSPEGEKHSDNTNQK